MMKRVKQSISIIFLLGAYSVSLLIGNLAHQHISAHAQVEHPALASHTCGDHERHIPLDLVRSCAICVQSGQRVATLSSSADLFHLAVRTGELPLPVATGMSHIHPSSPESRGPPLA